MTEEKQEEPKGREKPKPKPMRKQAPKPKPKPKSTPKLTAKSEPETDALPQGQAAVVKKLLESLEKKLTGDQLKASLGDYIRLVQLHKELDEESPREIKVTWVEPAGDKMKKTESENEG